MSSKLKALRQKKGWSQEQLARIAKVSKRSIQDYEQNRRDINKAQAGTIKRLASKLGCTMEELLE